MGLPNTAMYLFAGGSFFLRDLLSGLGLSVSLFALQRDERERVCSAWSVVM